MRRPTTRMCVDIGHKCNINCLHCYHKHEANRDKKPFMLEEEILAEIEKGFYRGCDYVDFTGGEPTLCTYLPKIISEIKQKWNMKSCVITNALCGKVTLEKFILAGVDDFLISTHGMGIAHDAFVQRAGARDQQEIFIKTLDDAKVTYRFNYCITSKNQNDLVSYAEWAVRHNPTIVNFINFNPHHAWRGDVDGTKDIIADLSKVKLMLDESIQILEKAGIGVNVRYYPMCQISEKYRRCICNDLHVTFDPYEWDYCIFPKTPEKHLQWGIVASNGNELKGPACSYCKLQCVCGGVNKYFYEAAGPSCIEPVKVFDGNIFDNYHYRKDASTIEQRDEE